MKEQEYLKILKDIDKRIYEFKRGTDFAMILGQNIKSQKDIDQHNSAPESLKRLIIQDLEEIIGTIRWFIEEFKNYNISTDPASDSIRIRLLFKLLIQEFSNLQNCYAVDKYDPGDVKRIKNEIKSKVKQCKVELESIVKFRNLMLVHAVTGLSGFGMLNDINLIDFCLIFSNDLSESERSEIEVCQNQLQNRSQEDRERLRGELRLLLKRAGGNSPWLSGLTDLTNRLSIIFTTP